MVNAVVINVMVQCSETELDHYINANGIISMLTRNSPKTISSITLVNADG